MSTMENQTLLYAMLIGLLLLFVPVALAQDNGTDTAAASCICEGRGELFRYRSLAWIPKSQSLYNKLISTIGEPAASDLNIAETTCGDIQDLFLDSTECPEASWLSFCCSDSPPFSQCADQVRKQALDGYDKLTIPSNTLLYDPVKVSVQMIYHTVTDISEAKGVMEAFVHLYLKWNDPRLAWEYDPSPDGACTALPVSYRTEMQQGLKDSEIWVPEFDLYNQISGVKGMGGVLSTVDMDGNVTWFRQGSIKAICQMENLGEIPFEKLGCQLLMGSNNLGVTYQLDPSGGIQVSNYAGPYNGYRLVDAEPGFNKELDLIFFNFEFSRGTSFYVQNILIPVTLFSFCSILTMVVGVGAFQTLALNFTLLLTTTTQKVSTARLLPVTNESLWVSKHPPWYSSILGVLLTNLWTLFLCRSLIMFQGHFILLSSPSQRLFSSSLSCICEKNERKQILPTKRMIPRRNPFSHLGFSPFRCEKWMSFAAAAVSWRTSFILLYFLPL